MIKRIDIANGAGCYSDLYEIESANGDYVYFSEIREIVEQAFMAGQADAGVDPSHSSAQAYAVRKGL